MLQSNNQSEHYYTNYQKFKNKDSGNVTLPDTKYFYNTSMSIKFDGV